MKHLVTHIRESWGGIIVKQTLVKLRISCGKNRVSRFGIRILTEESGLAMKRAVCVCLVLLFAVSNGRSATMPPDVNKMKFEITRLSKDAGMLHWKLTNNSDDGVYVYNFFLLGPAYNIEHSPGKLIFDTSPIARAPSCPPNRVAPLLLLFIRSGGVIEGDFVDAEMQKTAGGEVSLKIAVGSEPNTVVEEAKRFSNSNCKHNPYDAVVNWGTLVESTRIRVP